MHELLTLYSSPAGPPGGARGRLTERHGGSWQGREQERTGYLSELLRQAGQPGEGQVRNSG